MIELPMNSDTPEVYSTHEISVNPMQRVASHGTGSVTVHDSSHVHGTIRISLSDDALRLNALLNEVTEENRHAEIAIDGPRGQEVW